MPKQDAIGDWDGVCAFLETFPETVRHPPEGRVWGEVVRVAGKPVAFPGRNERSRPDGYDDEEEFLIVKIDKDEREGLLARDPDTFFLTPHYETYPGVIVRLASVDQDELRELLTDAWLRTAPKRLVREWEQR